MLLHPASDAAWVAQGSAHVGSVTWARAPAEAARKTAMATSFISQRLGAMYDDWGSGRVWVEEERARGEGFYTANQHIGQRQTTTIPDAGPNAGKRIVPVTSS